MPMKPSRSLLPSRFPAVSAAWSPLFFPTGAVATSRSRDLGLPGTTVDLDVATWWKHASYNLLSTPCAATGSVTTPRPAAGFDRASDVDRAATWSQGANGQKQSRDGDLDLAGASPPRRPPIRCVGGKTAADSCV